jgi:hypothetical protein
MSNMKRFSNLRLLSNCIKQVLTSYEHTEISFGQGGNTFLQRSWPASYVKSLLPKGKDNIALEFFYIHNSVSIVYNTTRFSKELRIRSYNVRKCASSELVTTRSHKNGNVTVSHIRISWTPNTTNANFVTNCCNTVKQTKYSICDVEFVLKCAVIRHVYEYAEFLLVSVDISHHSKPITNIIPHTAPFL